VAPWDHLGEISYSIFESTPFVTAVADCHFGRTSILCIIHISSWSRI
jgi:hypothetical protein